MKLQFYNKNEKWNRAGKFQCNLRNIRSKKLKFFIRVETDEIFFAFLINFIQEFKAKFVFKFKFA